MNELHRIGEDLGIPADYRHSFETPHPPDGPTWLDRAIVLLELDAQARLTAERVMDEIDAARA